MRWFWVSLWVLSASTAWAQCVTVDVSGWSQDQRNLLPSASYRLLFLSGQDIVPTVEQGEVCVSGTADLSGLTTSVLLQEVKQQRQEVSQQAKDKAASLKASKAKMKTKLNLTDQDLEELKAVLED